MRTNVGLPKTDINSVLFNVLTLSLRLHLLFLAARTFLLQFKKPLQFVESFLKLFYTTDSRFSALYLDEI